MYRVGVVLFLVVILATWSYSYNILVVFPYPGRSHFLTYARFFKGLAEKGHNVTVLSHYPLQEPVKNYRDIEIGGMEEFFQTKFDVLTNLQNSYAKSRLPMYFTFLVIHNIGQLACEMGMTAKVVQRFLKEDNKFDVAILESFNTDCFLTLVKQFDVPVVRVTSDTIMPWANHKFGNPNNPAYIPNVSLKFSNKMTFLERVENTVLTWAQTFFFNYIVGTKSDTKVSMKYFGELGSSIPTDVYNNSLMLMDTHFTLNFPRPLLPNIIEVGGIHIGKAKPLQMVRYIFQLFLHIVCN